MVNDITLPIADAGPDQIIDQGTTWTFDGSGSYDNLVFLNYTWTFMYSDDEEVLFGYLPSFTFNTPGDFSIKLNVSDEAGNWNEDSMIMSVRDVTPPVSEAGEDQTVTVGSIVVLNGSLSNDNNAIKKYSRCFFMEMRSGSSKESLSPSPSILLGIIL